jgi:hypothetical protein
MERYVRFGFLLAQPPGASLLLGFAAILILVTIIIPMFGLLLGFFYSHQKVGFKMNPMVLPL